MRREAPCAASANDLVYVALPDADAQLLVETAIESGLRWGELAELRVRDLDLATRMLTVSRKVTEVNREFHPDGRRFLVRLYPKDKECRRLKLSPQIVAKLQAHVKARGLGPDGLLFARRPAAPAPLRVVTEPEALGFTPPTRMPCWPPTTPPPRQQHAPPRRSTTSPPPSTPPAACSPQPATHPPPPDTSCQITATSGLLLRRPSPRRCPAGPSTPCANSRSATPPCSCARPSSTRRHAT